jgi:hypothetical protein
MPVTPVKPEINFQARLDVNRESFVDMKNDYATIHPKIVLKDRHERIDEN